MTSNKIVIKFIDGNVKKGTTNNFEPDKNSFSLKTIDGEQEEVHIVGIKSIFFVRDFEGKNTSVTNTKIISPTQAEKSR
jgi:hypothetical protein